MDQALRFEIITAVAVTALSRARLGGQTTNGIQRMEPVRVQGKSPSLHDVLSESDFVAGPPT